MGMRRHCLLLACQLRASTNPPHRLQLHRPHLIALLKHPPLQDEKEDLKSLISHLMKNRILEMSVTLVLTAFQTTRNLDGHENTNAIPRRCALGNQKTLTSTAALCLKWQKLFLLVPGPPSTPLLRKSTLLESPPIP